MQRAPGAFGKGQAKPKSTAALGKLHSMLRAQHMLLVLSSRGMLVIWRCAAERNTVTTSGTGAGEGEKRWQANRKKPICKYCKECMFSFVLLLSPFVSYQLTSCQLGEVPAYFFFPVKCFSMPERIKMNVNEVY